MATLVETCTVCDGFGVVTKNVPVDHPDFGKSFPCPACNIALQRRRDNIVKMSNLEHFQSKTFETYHTDMPWLNETQATHLRLIIERAREYAQHPEGWLLMMGSTGVGKTHLAAAIAHEAVAKGLRTIFATAPDLLDYLRATFAPDSSNSYDQQFDMMKNVQMLVIDDLGSESASKWAQEKLYQLLNHRYNANLPTVITTNATEEQLDERIASRLLDITSTIQMHMKLPDYRRGGHALAQSNSITALSDLDRYRHMMFENFETSEEPLRREVQKIYRYAQKPEGWLVLVGGVGAGKTHLAAAVANHWKPLNSMQAMIVSTPDLIDFLMATFSPDSGITINRRFEEIRNADLLVLDDFGASEKTSAWVAQKLFQLLDHRYLMRLPTVITISDAKMTGLREKYPEIASRLADTRLATWVILKTSDYRRPSR